jgi:hypothetical protein
VTFMIFENACLVTWKRSVHYAGLCGAVIKGVRHKTLSTRVFC